MKKKAKNSITPKLEFELLEKGYRNIVGIDEVGRGAWAGPMTLCGYSFSADTIIIPGINDSKKLSKSKREFFSNKLELDNYKIVDIPPQLIDKEGLSSTIVTAINVIIDHFKSAESFFLIDGYFPEDFGKNTTQIKKGDEKHYSIACASVLAKCSRDDYLSSLALEFPGYGFETNAGYGTKEHRAALESYGVTEIHRKSYKPIQKLTDE